MARAKSQRSLSKWTAQKWDYVTKSDKKDKKGVYTSKHIRNLLKQKEAAIDKRNNGPIPATSGALLPNGRV